MPKKHKHHAELSAIERDFRCLQERLQNLIDKGTAVTPEITAAFADFDTALDTYVAQEALLNDGGKQSTEVIAEMKKRTDKINSLIVKKTSDAPVINSINPLTGQVGTAVTIAGTGFGTSGKVSFNGTDAGTAASWSDTQIVTSVPSGATSGQVIVTPSGGVASNGESFTVA